MFAALILAATSAPSPASTRESNRYSADHERCMATGDAARAVTTGILDCNRAEIDRQDVRLNAAYRKAMSRLGPARKARLRALEKAWIKHRERNCDKQAEPQAGAACT